MSITQCCDICQLEVSDGCDICNGHPRINHEIAVIMWDNGPGNKHKTQKGGYVPGTGYNIPNPNIGNHNVSGTRVCNLCRHYHSGRCKV